MASKYKKRPDGRYMANVQIGIQENGKPKYKSLYGKTIKELDEKVSAFKLDLEKGIIVDDQRLTVAVWAKRWLDVYKSGKELNTYKMYANVVNNHIIPILGNYRLKDLKQHHIQELINNKSVNGYTKTIVNIKQAISQILDKAVENELIYKNVALKVDMPTIEKTKKRSLTDEEKLLLSKADLDLRCKAFVFTLLYTGVRRGEILALTKKDIDLIKKTVIIDKAVVFDGNKTILKPNPKSDAGNRTIPLPTVLTNVLKEYLPTVDSPYVFPSTRNELMTQTAFRRMWEKILRRLEGVANRTQNDDSQFSQETIANDITPHIFRHTYATMLYYAGVDIKKAQYLLGHSSIEMTLEIYTHLDEINDNTTSNKIDLHLSNII